MAKINYEKKGKVAFITLNRPEVRNAIDREMVDTLDALWKEFENDRDIWVGILTGAGGHFCSGYDVKAIRDRQDQGVEFVWERSSMFGAKRIGPDGHGVTKPIIGAFDGSVNGAGVWLAFQTDVRIATERTEFGLGEARFNFPVEFTALISRYIPRAIAAEMLFSLKKFKALRLFELGIINEIVSEGELMKTAEKTAHELTQRGPLSLRAMKELLDFDPNYSERLRFSAEKLVPIVNSDDTQEAVRAFVEKRKPEWRLK